MAKRLISAQRKKAIVMENETVCWREEGEERGEEGEGRGGGRAERKKKDYPLIPIQLQVIADAADLALSKEISLGKPCNDSSLRVHTPQD